MNNTQVAVSVRSAKTCKAARLRERGGEGMVRPCSTRGLPRWPSHSHEPILPTADGASVVQVASEERSAYGQ